MKWLLAVFFIIFHINFVQAQAQYDVVILGSGPAGLAAALTAKQLGLTALVVEKREQEKWGTRQRIVAIDQQAIDAARQLTQAALPASALKSYHVYSAAGVQVFDKGDRLDLAKIAFGRTFGGVIKISELEDAFIKSARAQGVEVVYSAQAEDIHVNSKNVTINIDHGNEIKTVQSRYVVVAEGAHSATLKKLVVAKLNMGFPDAKWIVANFKTSVANQGQYRAEFRRNSSHPFYGLALMHNGITTVYASPYDGNSEIKDIDAVIKQTARLLQVSGEYQNDATLFESSVERSEKFSVQNRILIIGDAARKTDPATGFGVTSALADTLRLQRFFIRAERAKNDLEMRMAVTGFESDMHESVQLVKNQVERFKAVKFAVRTDVAQGPLSLGVSALNLLIGREQRQDTWRLGSIIMRCEVLF
jgi:2-polyprenyl-6-methoxyphenol hydroxylase-like FAD-dependent oxidoreductase